MIDVVAQTSDILGEGPCWSPVERRLYWFDIKGRKLHWLSPETGDTARIDLPVRASAAAPRAAGGLLLATEAGLAICRPDEGGFDLIRPMALQPGYRTNDGKLDPQGRFWWSTMDDDGGRRPGAVFRTDSDLRTVQMLDGIHIPNTLCVTADSRTLLLADSMRRTIFACDVTTPDLRRVFVRTEDKAAPDGGALDAEGGLWNAHWGGGRIVRYAPDGRLDRIVTLPAPQPTSCAFGGADLSTLYITSARDGLSAVELGQHPLSGSLFALRPGISGLPLPLFAG